MNDDGGDANDENNYLTFQVQHIYMHRLNKSTIVWGTRAPNKCGSRKGW